LNGALVKGKRSTNTKPDADLTQVSVRSKEKPDSSNTLVPINTSDQDQFQLDQLLGSKPGADLPQVVARPDADLTIGIGIKTKRKRERQGASGTAAKRGTRIEEGWTIPDEWIDWAIGNALDQGHHVPRLTVLRISERFHDYYLSKAGQDATSLNWLARWRSWWAREDVAKLANPRIESAQPDAISRAR
jgi:hypothetical protein